MKKIDISKLSAYELVSKENISDLNSEGFLLKHKKTGARVVLMNNDDDNKVFYIGFRTTPKDSTGVMHILEHSVLCGSKEFPVKDPFIELAKGSLNTFLNAMTYPDKTVYPVASCNDKDFQNLMHIYLDAVFYPNSMNTDMTFKQEGWHYEMESIDDELTINGVVYNEMKGALSSPDDILEREIFNSLFPETTYAVESGGDPKNIPDLTYEQYKDTYNSYYHPSNSYIYLYGDMDFEEKLSFIDEHYLSNFDGISVNSEVKSQKAFEKAIDVKKSYSITSSEPLEENSYISYNCAMTSNLNPEEYIAFQMINYALCTAPGAVLKQRLLDEGMGKDIYSYYDNGVKQPYFSVVAKNSEANRKEKFISLIEEVLKDVIEKGFDKDTLRASVNALEFKYREADFGSYPPGLMYGLQILDSWLYDDTLPFIHIASGEVYKSLRKKIDGDYYEKLVEKNILNNNHKTYVTVVPEVGLVEKEEEALRNKLAEYKAGLSKEELQKIVDDTVALREYQDREESEEELACIPVLEREDIRKNIVGFDNEERTIGDNKSLYHGIDTHGIDYFRFVFNANDIPEDCIPYIGVLKNFAGLVDTKNYTYGELFNKINIETGGIASAVNIYTDYTDLDKNNLTFEWKAKVIKGGLKPAFELLEEIIKTSDYSNEKRNYELVAEIKSHAQATMMSAGHQLAIARLGTYFSKGAVLTDIVSNMTNYRLIEKIESDYEGNKKELADKLQKLVECIFVKENLMFDFAGDESEYTEFSELALEFAKMLPSKKEVENVFTLVPEVKNEGIMSSSQVNYVCRGGSFIDKGLSYTGTLKVLKVIMSYEYLWTNVRVKGGAYGCMCSFSRNGDGFFVSYRDPNLAKTIDVYEGIAEYLEKFDSNERAMTQFVIGAISEMDTPLTPANKALRSLSAYMTNIPEEVLQRERDEVIAATKEDIQSLAKIVRAILEDGYVCVVGNEEAIKSEKDRFMNLENMFKA